MTATNLRRRIATLSEREASILVLFGAGLTMQEVADECGIVKGTARSHALNIRRKLGARNTAHATAMFFYVCGRAP